MYGASFVRCGCTAEARSRPQQRTAGNSGGGIYLGSREAGQNKRSDLPPREGARGQRGHCKGRYALAVRSCKWQHNLLVMLKIDNLK